MYGTDAQVTRALTFLNNIWRNNEATNGGCIYLANPFLGSQTITMENETVTSNKAQNDGGFLHCANAVGTLTITGSQFNLNSAMANGGVVSLPTDDTNVTLIHSHFSENHANVTGGILHTIAVGQIQHLEVTQCTLQANWAGVGGGFGLIFALSNTHNVTMTNNIVMSGNATNGGVLSIFLNMAIPSPTLLLALNNNLVTNVRVASTNGLGGFARLFLTNVTTLELNARDNVFQNVSGGVFSIDHSQAANQNITLERNHFDSNTAIRPGAVISSVDSTEIHLSLLDNQLVNHDNNYALIYLSSQQCFIHSTYNEYANNTHTHIHMLTPGGQFVSINDQILDALDNWLLFNSTSDGPTIHQNVSVSHLSASNPHSFITMISALNGANQTLSLLNVSISDSLDTSQTLVAMEASGVGVMQTITTTDSSFSNVHGRTFSMSASNTKGDQRIQLQNATMKQLVTPYLGGTLDLNIGSGGTQAVELVDRTWEGCQTTSVGGILSANRLDSLNVTNCQFKHNTALNGSLFAVDSNSGSDYTFTSNRFLQNQVKDAVILFNGTVRLHFVNHTVVDDTPLHLWATNLPSETEADTSLIQLAGVFANYSTSTPLLARSEAANMSLDQLELTLLNATSNMTVLSYAIQPQPWASAVVKHVNTTRGCFNGYQVLYNSSHTIAQLNAVSCPALDIPSNSTGNVTVTGIVVLYPNQTLNVSTDVQIQVEEGGCLLLEGDLHLRLGESALPGSQPVLIQGCFDGQFANVTLDNSHNPQICQVSPIYAASQVLLSLEACDAAAVGPSVPVGAIVGGVVGGVVFVALVVALTVYFVKRYQRKLMSKKLSAKLERANHRKANRKTLGSEALSNPSYANEGKSGENAIYE